MSASEPAGVESPSVTGFMAGSLAGIRTGPFPGFNPGFMSGIVAQLMGCKEHGLETQMDE